ncbi:MAG: glutamate synthase-related protein [archaeon]
MKYNNKKNLRTHKNNDIVTGTSLVNPEHVSQSGLCSICTMEGNCEVGKRAKTGETLFPKPFGTAQFGGEKKTPCLDDLQIIPELYGPSIDFEEVKVSSKIGSFKVSVPIAIASMGSTKVAHQHGEALSEGAARAGIPLGVGENVLATYGERVLRKRIQPYLDHYNGKGALVVQLNENEKKKGLGEKACSLGAHALEIKLGQGAKQELGGEIEFESDKDAKKYREWGYKVKKTDKGTYQRHAKPPKLSDEDLENFILEAAEFDLPVWVKTGIGRGITKLIKRIHEINEENGQLVEALTVDGHEGGTGMSPWLIMNEMSVPSAALFTKLDFEPNFDILLAGGYNSGADIMKGILIGAKGASMGRSFLIAAGTIKDGEKMGADGVVNYVEALKEELQMFTTTLDKEDLNEVRGKKENILALSEESGKMFGVTSDIKKIL